VLCSADDVAQEVCAAVVNALPAYRLQPPSFTGVDDTPGVIAG
jgi:hypothetical protein